MLTRVLVIFLSLFLLSSCTNHSDSKDNILYLTTQGDPKTFNPWIATDANSSELANLMFEGLLETNPDTDEVIPHLAQGFKIQDNGKTIIIKLHKNLIWSDGKPITSHDVDFTWNTLLKDQVAISSLRDILLIDGQFPDIEVVDDYTLVFRIQEIFAPFLKMLSIKIAPKHAIEAYLKNAKTLKEKQQLFNSYLSLDSKPETIVGSGAFLLHKYEPGQRIEFRANNNFFLKDGQNKPLPYLQKVIYSVVQDPNSAVLKFLAGESDLLNVSAQEAALIKKLEKKYNYTLYDLGPNTGTSFLWFNLSKNIAEPKYSWFNNVLFRQAISLTINRKDIVQNVFQGIGAELFTAESLRSPFVHPELKNGYKQDLILAKELLKKAGFNYRNQRLYDKNSNPIEFDFYTNAGNPERELIAVMILQDLAKLGIKVNYKALEFNNLVARISQGSNYDSALLGLTGSNEPNSGANVWRSNGRLHLFDIKGFQKEPITRPWEKEIDELFTAGVRDYDFEKRKLHYYKIQEIISRENPLIYIASGKDLVAVNNRIKGVRQTKYGGVIPYLYRVSIHNK